MLGRRITLGMAALAALCVSAPASAQFFFKPVDLSGPPVTGNEPGMIAQAMPGATPAELRAAMVWSLRAALNVAALQCKFEPTLLADDNYVAARKDHEEEFNKAYDTLEKYFLKTAKTKKAAQTALDQFSTRVYSSFSTVSGQLSFCQTTASIGQDAVYAPHGTLGDVAMRRMRELRESLKAWGEQHFRTRRLNFVWPVLRPLPQFGQEKCWRNGEYQSRKCGSLG